MDTTTQVEGHEVVDVRDVRELTTVANPRRVQL